MGKWCLHASLFLGNKDMFKSYKRFDFWHAQTADIGGTKPWKNNCSYLKTIQIFNDFTCWLVWNERMLAHWTQVSDRCSLGYLFLFSVFLISKHLNLASTTLFQHISDGYGRGLWACAHCLLYLVIKFAVKWATKILKIGCQIKYLYPKTFLNRDFCMGK